MHKGAIALVGMLAILGPAAVGYWFGAGHWPGLSSIQTDEGTPDASPAASNRRVLYWRDPDGKPAYAASPTKTADGRDFVAVTDNEEPPLPGDPPAVVERASFEPQPKDERKIKFYRNPMGLPDISHAPKKDWMGMDYIAVYEGEEDEDGSSVRVSLGKVQRAGVRSEEVRMATLARPLRVPGVAKPDERTLHAVTMRADAFIEELYVNETGQQVKAGDPLFKVYSPDLLRALVDLRSNSGPGVISAEQKLKILQVPPEIIAKARSGDEVMPAFDFPSPASGVVMEKMVVDGMMMKMGDTLYRLADLSSIWVIASVAEQDLGQVKVGSLATVTFQALPGKTYQGRVTFILHEIEMQTRTAKVRIEIANPDHRIRHEMYADVTIAAGEDDDQRLVVSASAVLDSGSRQAVLVDKGEGRFEPRPVKLGLRGDGLVEVTEGLSAGEKVVTSANFLIDAESNLKAALQGFTADAPAPVAAEPTAERKAEPMKPQHGSTP